MAESARQDLNVLDTAYNRLDEAHRAWHMALEGYHRIDDFRAGVNSAIQAFQNIVYALEYQKDQKILPDFDRWFDEQKKKMITDRVLSALHSGRVLVVHQEDLKLRSTAVVRTKGWVEFEKTAFTFDPLKDSYGVAKGFYETFAKTSPITETHKDRLVFEFERQWVYEKLPDYELLDALSYTYHFFYEMLQHASQEFSLPLKNGFQSGAYCHSEFNSRGKLNCMVVTPQERCLTFSFKNGSPIKLQNGRILRDEDELNKSRERYGDEWKSKDTTALTEGLFPKGYPFDQMRLHVQVAIANLKKDGHLLPVSLIFKEKDDVPVIIAHPFLNQEGKILALDKVATEIVKNNGKFVLTMTEAWVFKFNEEDFVFPTENDPRGAQDILQIFCLSAKEVVIIAIPFHKNLFGKITFSRPEIKNFSADKHHYYVLLPLIDALKKVVRI